MPQNQILEFDILRQRKNQIQELRRKYFLDGHEPQESVPPLIRYDLYGMRSVIVSLPEDGDILVWTRFTDFFTIKTYNLVNAALHINKLLNQEGYVSVADYLSLLGVTCPHNELLPEEFGWSIDDLIEQCATNWLDIWYTKNVTDDGLEYYEIEFLLDPATEHFEWDDS